jgi:hypothetical protein
MRDLQELKKLHDKAYSHGQVTREKAADDMLFYWVTQWDDNVLGETQLQYLGEFNILRKAGRQIISDLRANPIQIDFKPKDEGRDDGADLLDGLYLTDDRVNTTLEAYDNAKMEAVVCGVGAWELYTDYQTNRAGDENQVIRRRPLYEANNNVFWDPNAKRMDKSDAKYVSILTAYSRDGYIDLVHELTGEEKEQINLSSFGTPEDAGTFVWADTRNELFYIATIYCREKVKDKVLTMTDPFGQTLVLRESDLTEIMDEMLDAGYEITGEKDIKRWKVTKYIVSGEDVLSEDAIASDHIPVVPEYGERAFVGGEETYEGVTRLAKDPQRLRNFQMSYLADIVSRSPRRKPIFTPDQIAGFEFMYEEAGPDSNYPYYLQNRFDANGNQMPLGPVAEMPEQPIPSALMASMELSRQAVEDVANPGVPQDIADPDLSGKAVMALQNRLDQQSLVYQQNHKHAKRRDAEIYASMASYVYDAPRTVTLTLPDGTTKTAKIMESVIDRETGDIVVLNDLTNAEFEVYADIGPSYNSKREQTIEQLGAMAQMVAQTNPALMEALLLKQITMVDGVAMDDIREYASKQLLLSGFRQPEDEEEEALLAQAQQGQQPDAATLMAMAEMEKAKADQMREQREAQEGMAEAQISQQKNQIGMYDAMTKRAKVEVDAEKAGYDMRKTLAETESVEFENIRKQMEALSDSDLMRIAIGAA